MDCYKIEKDKIVRYEVFVKKEELEKLRMEIIQECSKIVHHKEHHWGSFINFLRIEDFCRYKNINEKFLRTEERYRFTGEYGDVYEVSYDEYIFPDVIKQIDSILESIEDETTCKVEGRRVNELLQYQVAPSDEIFPLSLDTWKEKIGRNTNDPASIRKDMEQIEDFLDFYELNKNQKPITPYLQKLQSCFHFQRINEIPIDDFVNVYLFLNERIQEGMESVLDIDIKQYLNSFQNDKPDGPKMLEKTVTHTQQ